MLEADASPPAEVALAKSQLRRRVRAGRRARAASADRAAEAEAVAAALLAALDPPRGARVASYEALPTEPPTDVLAARLLGRGVTVVVPVLLADLDLDWRPAGATHALGPDAVAAADVVVVPALSVDRSGTRLGQGGGSYDRALARRGPGSLVVAVVNDEEYVEGPLPRAGHDARVDAVVTTGGRFVRLPQSG